MEEQIHREPKPVKPTQFKIDESKLSPGQRRAFEIAKAQGAPFTRRLEDLIQDVDEKDAKEFTEAIMAARREGRKNIPRNPFED